MKNVSINKTDSTIRICIKKDLKELVFWISVLESFNRELNHIKIIEKQLIKNPSISKTIKGFMRKNVLMTASLYKYEQELKIEYEYGKTEYSIIRSKYHEDKRKQFEQLIGEYDFFKNQLYSILKRFRL